MLVFSNEVAKKPLILFLTKSFFSAIRTLSYTGSANMDRNVRLIPFWLEFGFAFGTNVCLGNYNEIRYNENNKYRNSYKIPLNVIVTAKPINATRREHKS